MKRPLLTLGVLALLGVMLLCVDAQIGNPCETCSVTCTNMTRTRDYGDPFCSCPTSAGCIGTELCSKCTYDGIVVCTDRRNNCGSTYRATFDQFCGCDDEVASKSCSAPLRPAGD